MEAPLFTSVHQAHVLVAAQQVSQSSHLRMTCNAWCTVFQTDGATRALVMI